jgi:hypothetical protein
LRRLQKTMHEAEMNLLKEGGIGDEHSDTTSHDHSLAAGSESSMYRSTNIHGQAPTSTSSINMSTGGKKPVARVYGSMMGSVDDDNDMPIQTARGSPTKAIPTTRRHASHADDVQSAGSPDLYDF